MYFILETQTNDGVGAALPIHTAETRENAMSIYHSILASAAISTVQYHTCVVMDEQGKYLARECYIHLPDPVEVEETEE